MCSFLDRIKIIADSEGFTMTSFEERIGTSKGVFTKAIKKNSGIQAKWLIAIIEKYPQYSSEWLLTGKGEILQKDEPKSRISVEHYYNILEENNKYLKEIIELKEKVEEQKKQIAQLLSENVTLKKGSQNKKVG